jgi:hypothetical protein
MKCLGVLSWQKACMSCCISLVLTNASASAVAPLQLQASFAGPCLQVTLATATSAHAFADVPSTIYILRKIMCLDSLRTHASHCRRRHMHAHVDQSRTAAVLSVRGLRARGVQMNVRILHVRSSSAHF